MLHQEICTFAYYLLPFLFNLGYIFSYTKFNLTFLLRLLFTIFISFHLFLYFTVTLTVSINQFMVQNFRPTLSLNSHFWFILYLYESFLIVFISTHTQTHTHAHTHTHTHTHIYIYIYIYIYICVCVWCVCVCVCIYIYIYIQTLPSILYRSSLDFLSPFPFDLFTFISVSFIFKMHFSKTFFFYHVCFFSFILLAPFQFFFIIYLMTSFRFIIEFIIKTPSISLFIHLFINSYFILAYYP